MSIAKKGVWTAHAAVVSAVGLLALGAGPAAAATCPTNPSAEAGSGVVWDGCNLEGANLKGADLEGADLEETNLKKANLEGANLKEANLKKANFTEAKAKEAKLEKAALTEATGKEADLEKANLEGAATPYEVPVNLEKANLKEASLKEAKISGAVGNEVNFKEVDLEKADTEKVELDPNVDLEGADLKKANILEGDIRYARAQGADFEEADLEKAVTHGSEFRRANFKNANLKEADALEDSAEADFEGADLEGVSMFFSEFTRANFKEANLKKADLRFAELEETNLDGAKLEGDNLKKANLEKAKLEGTHLEEADLEEVDLEGAFLKNTKLEKANLTKTNLEGADLEGANLKGAKLEGATESSETNWKDATCPGGESSAKHIAGSCLQGLDTTAPTLTSATFKGGTAGKNGWYTTPVFVEWAWSDVDGVLTVTSTNCPASTVSTEEGEFTFEPSAKCEDNAGNGSGNTFTATGVAVKVDTRPPNAPKVEASRPPDYAGGGGWYKDSVEVSFASGGDPTPGSGVNTASLPAARTFNTDGSHTAEGTEEDNAGNISQKASLTVQVDATAPTLQLTCPTSVPLGTAGATATFTASDGQSGLKTPASGTVPINTSTAGKQTVTETAIDNVGHETTKNCTTQVVYSRTIKGTFLGTLVVKTGQSVLVSPKATIDGGVTIEEGGALDVEGATINGQITTSKATLLRVCGASINGGGVASNGTGKVVIGEGISACPGSRINGSLTVTGNSAGVQIVGNMIGGALTVTANAGGATVTKNKVSGNLTVTGNAGTVVDRPNTVTGKTNIQ
jgi:uncharacterized protein YjbI with pentapeptide repeats